jgi:hypothetical protein
MENLFMSIAALRSIGVLPGKAGQTESVSEIDRQSAKNLYGGRRNFI